MNKSVLTIFLIFFYSFTFSQVDTGQISFKLYPVIGETYVQIEDSLYSQLRARLPAGKYDITLWAPNYLPLDTTVTIYNDSLVYFRKILTPTPEYLDFINEKKRYKKKVTIPKVIYFTTSGVLSSASLLSYFSARKRLKRVDEAYRLFETSEIHSIERTKDTYNYERDEYNKSKKRFYTTGAITVISWGVTWWQLRRLKKKYAKPKYKPRAPYFDLSMESLPTFNRANQKNDLMFSLKMNF